MNILFYDPVTPSLYTDETLIKTGLGGTESTVVKIAHSLKNHHTIYVAQHCRQPNDDVESNGVHYISFATAHKLSPDVVVLLRYYKLIEDVALKFPRSRLYLWMHNMPSRSLFSMRKKLLNHNYEIIAVSNFHREEIIKRVQGKWYQRILHLENTKTQIPVHVIYNPINDDLVPDNTSWNPNQMLLASTPYKGLAYNLKSFELVLEKFPEYQLLIATYTKWDDSVKLPKQVRFLGSLPKKTLIQYTRESFCVFYPQPLRCETFGLVYAESNAVGTPVLAHDFGAAREVLSDSSQLVNGRNNSSILSKIEEWRKERPLIVAKQNFRLSAITPYWLKLIGS